MSDVLSSALLAVSDTRIRETDSEQERQTIYQSRGISYKAVFLTMIFFLTLLAWILWATLGPQATSMQANEQARYQVLEQKIDEHLLAHAHHITEAHWLRMQADIQGLSVRMAQIAHDIKKEPAQGGLKGPDSPGD